MNINFHGKISIVLHCSAESSAITLVISLVFIAALLFEKSRYLSATTPLLVLALCHRITPADTTVKLRAANKTFRSRLSFPWQPCFCFLSVHQRCPNSISLCFFHHSLHHRSWSLASSTCISGCVSLVKLWCILFSIQIKAHPCTFENILHAFSGLDDPQCPQPSLLELCLVYRTELHSK